MGYGATLAWLIFIIALLLTVILFCSSAALGVLHRANDPWQPRPSAKAVNTRRSTALQLRRSRIVPGYAAGADDHGVLPDAVGDMTLLAIKSRINRRRGRWVDPAAGAADYSTTKVKITPSIPCRLKTERFGNWRWSEKVVDHPVCRSGEPGSGSG